MSDKSQVQEGKAFFDSNILVYFVDGKDQKKQKIAQELIAKTVQMKNGVLSTQSLQEFYSVVTRKSLCSKEEAKTIVEKFRNTLPITQISVTHILKAIDISIQTQFSFWDSLIVSAAHSSGCVIVYSEDMSHNQFVNGVKIINPFMK
ncbi:MAG: PIN domain-containing protein [Treponema sp.]|nr:PIN domain-containing protein [Treponema sp.]